jgi:hypothetical protein
MIVVTRIPCVRITRCGMGANPADARRRMPGYAVAFGRERFLDLDVWTRPGLRHCTHKPFSIPLSAGCWDSGTGLAGVAAEAGFRFIAEAVSVPVAASSLHSRVRELAPRGASRVQG